MYEGGAVIASICTGSYILAEAGLLEGRPATTHWALERHMSESYPQVQVMSRKPMVITGEGGRLVMSGTGMYQTNLTLYVIQRFLGVEATHDYARASGKFWSADSDDVYARSAQRWNASDGLMREVQEWFARNLVQASPVTAAAKVFGLSERSLTRRFKQATGVSPVEYLQQIRIETARCLLERDRRSIEQIAAEIGYADVSYFSRLFKKLVGLTPGQYRRRFQLPPVRAVDHVSRPSDPPRN
jgi:transcriptional regulator GlxA family with amidase domain